MIHRSSVLSPSCVTHIMLARLGCSSLRQPAVPFAALKRWFATIEAESEAEKQIAAKIEQGLKAKSIKVSDTSGGCGAMYSIEVVSEDFKGLGIVKQHQLVTKLLKDNIAEWHGFQLVTRAS